RPGCPPTSCATRYTSCQCKGPVSPGYSRRSPVWREDLDQRIDGQVAIAGAVLGPVVPVEVVTLSHVSHRPDPASGDPTVPVRPVPCRQRGEPPPAGEDRRPEQLEPVPRPVQVPQPLHPVQRRIAAQHPA